MKPTIHDAPEIIIDTREQTPWEFGGHPTRIEALKTGDYSIDGLVGSVHIERKRHTEFVQCMTGERDRFVRELERSAELRLLHVVVECSLKALIEGRYEDWPSGTNLSAIKGTLVAWANRFPNVRFWFAGDRSAAQDFAAHMLKKTWLDKIEGKAGAK